MTAESALCARWQMSNLPGLNHQDERPLSCTALPNAFQACQFPEYSSSIRSG